VTFSEFLYYKRKSPLNGLFERFENIFPNNIIYVSYAEDIESKQPEVIDILEKRPPLVQN
jgi:hypothetical protein